MTALQGWGSHGDVGFPEHGRYLEGLQGGLSETQFLVEGPDSGHIVANAACRREVVGEGSDKEGHCGSIWINEVKMVKITELDKSLCLLDVVTGHAWVEGTGSQFLSHLLELMKGQVIWDEIIRCQIR